MEKNYMVAIDLGSSNVVVGVGTRAENGKVNIEDIVVKDSAGVSGGEVKNVESASAAVRKAIEEINERLGIKVSEACVGISGCHIQCAKHPYYVIVAGRDGEITDEDVRRLNESMHNMQAPPGYRLMHIIPQHYIVNDDEEVVNPVGRFGKTLGSTFNLIIGEDTIIQRLDKAMERSGAEVAKLFINPLAMADAVTFPDEKELGAAVIDIGAGTTDLCIYQEGIVRSVSVIPIGAETINKDIRSYGIMERYVEDLKTMYGCAVAEMVDAEKLVKIPGRTPNDYKDISFRNLASIIEARMTDIIDYVIEEIKEAGCEGKLGAGIVLTGGSAMLQEIKTLFERRTGLEVRIASPEILVTQESREKVSDPRMSVAVGILWQALNGVAQMPAEKTQEHPRHRDSSGTGGYGRPQPPRRSDDPVIPPVADDDTDWEDSPRKGRKVKQPKPPKPPKRKPAYPDDAPEDDIWAEEPERHRGEGMFGRLRKALTKAIDLEVLDDDDTTEELNTKKRK